SDGYRSPRAWRRLRALAMTDLAPDIARIAELTGELDHLRSRQEGVADILRALSSSGLRLQPILDQIVETATRLCRAESGFLHLVDGDLLPVRANFGQPEEVVEFERQRPDRPGPHSCTG